MGIDFLKPLKDVRGKSKEPMCRLGGVGRGQASNPPSGVLNLRLPIRRGGRGPARVVQPGVTHHQLRKKQFSSPRKFKAKA